MQGTRSWVVRQNDSRTTADLWWGFPASYFDLAHQFPVEFVCGSGTTKTQSIQKEGRKKTPFKWSEILLWNTNPNIRKMKILFSGMRRYVYVYVYKTFGETCFLHLQGIILTCRKRVFAIINLRTSNAAKTCLLNTFLEIWCFLDFRFIYSRYRSIIADLDM
jgi:hypothetical protein